MKNIIVREYLESLTESQELDQIFPMLLESMGFKIISTPKQTKGFQQYGKDVVAVGIDRADRKKKRFYFEIKGGADRHITTQVYNKTDGVKESIWEAMDRPFKDSSDPKFNKLPVKIVLVHNGIIKPNVKETFDGFIENTFGLSAKYSYHFEFERWDIYQLTELFSNHLFNEYLLTDDATVRHFKKVLLLLNTPRNDNSDFFALIDGIFIKAGQHSAMTARSRILLYETLNLTAFIIHSYADGAQNLEPAKRCLSFLVLHYWRWILENNVEKDKEAHAYFKKHLSTFQHLLTKYFRKTIPVAKLKDGLWANSGGRYEQIGYPIRALKFISELLVFFEISEDVHKPVPSGAAIATLIEVLNNNDGTTRPLLDIHSIPISFTLNYLIKNDRVTDAKVYVTNVLASIRIGVETTKRLPDGRNRIESVIQYIVTKKKSVYYEEKTSNLIAMLFEYLAVLDLKEIYDEYRRYFIKLGTDLAVFIPYQDASLMDDPEQKIKSHEVVLFTKTLYREGYQSMIILNEDFDSFKIKTSKKSEFTYQYRTVDAGFPSLLKLAHLTFSTPIFPNQWRDIINR